MPVTHADFHPNPQFLTTTFSLASVNSCYLPTKLQPFGSTLIESCWDEFSKRTKNLGIGSKCATNWILEESGKKGLTLFAGSALPIHRIITKLPWNLGNIMPVAHADFHPNPQFLTTTFSLASVNLCYLPTKPHSFNCGPYGPKSYMVYNFCFINFFVWPILIGAAILKKPKNRISGSGWTRTGLKKKLLILNHTKASIGVL